MPLSIVNSIVVLLQASYGVEDAEFAITQLAQTTMRSELGKIAMDTVFKERELLNIAIVGKLLHSCATVFISDKESLLTYKNRKKYATIIQRSVCNIVF